jgi:hypothetical protein
MSDTTTTDSEPQTEPQHDPGPDFKAKVREVLEEILPDFLTKEPEPEPTIPSKPRSLRQEESDMEHLVEKVLGKLKASEPPAPTVKPEPVVEVPPGPPPRKRRVQTLMWGD